MTQPRLWVCKTCVGGCDFCGGLAGVMCLGGAGRAGAGGNDTPGRPTAGSLKSGGEGSRSVARVERSGREERTNRSITITDKTKNAPMKTERAIHALVDNPGCAAAGVYSPPVNRR